MRGKEGTQTQDTSASDLLSCVTGRVVIFVYTENSESLRTLFSLRHITRRSHAPSDSV